MALTASGIKETLEDYCLAAINAKEAGFDGVEVHVANGYLIDQFLRTGTNQRSDEYGGGASNRVRFLTEAVEQVLGAWDSKQIGVRISPTVDFNDMSDDNPSKPSPSRFPDSTTLGLVTSTSLRGRRTAKEAPRRLSHYRII